MKEDHLAHETRKRIYSLIESSPGLHKREIARELGMSLSTIDYHLHYMEKRKMVVAKSDGKYKRYFPRKEMEMSKWDRKILSMLRQEVPRRILMFLLLHPKAIHKEICEYVGKAPSTVSFHMKKLIKEGIVEEISLGKEKAYVVLNEEKVASLLATYKETFVDRAVDKFVSTWADFGKLNP